MVNQYVRLLQYALQKHNSLTTRFYWCRLAHSDTENQAIEISATEMSATEISATEISTTESLESDLGVRSQGANGRREGPSDHEARHTLPVSCTFSCTSLALSLALSTQALCTTFGATHPLHVGFGMSIWTSALVAWCGAAGSSRAVDPKVRIKDT